MLVHVSDSLPSMLTRYRTQSNALRRALFIMRVRQTLPRRLAESIKSTAGVQSDDGRAMSMAAVNSVATDRICQLVSVRKPTI